MGQEPLVVLAFRGARAGRLACAAVLLLAGCDIVGGFNDAADGAVPAQKRYIDGPGERLQEGPWNKVVIDADYDTLYHVGARRIDDDRPAFHLFGADAQEGCEVSPNEGTWLMAKPERAPFRAVPFLESIDERGRGTLRFTSLECELLQLEVPDAGKPFDILYETGFVVPSGAGLSFVDPWAGEQRVLVEQLQTYLQWSDAVLLWGDGKLRSFVDQLEPVAEVGDDVQSVVTFDEGYVIEDSTGIQYVTFDALSGELTAEPILPGACGLQHHGFASDFTEGWLAMHLPCESDLITSVQLDPETLEISESMELPIQADARYARVSVQFGADGTIAHRAIFYLTDVDASGYGTLWAAREGDEPVRLGEHTTVETTSLAFEAQDWDGSAYVDLQQRGSRTTARWIRFHWDGTIETVAEDLLTYLVNSAYIVNFDGVAGDEAQLVGDELTVTAEGLPPFSNVRASYIQPDHYARIEHFDGRSGQLSLMKPDDRPQLWQTLAEGVATDGFKFAWFMPAVFFIEELDPETSTGSLVAYNYELEARTTVAEGVSSFDLTTYPWDGVLYSVPYGSRQGLWFAKAK